MKKSSIYFLVPLIALVAFGGIYYNFISGYDAEVAAKAKIERAAKEAKLQKDAKDREEAIKLALAAQDVRKADRAKKELEDQKREQQLQDAKDAREKSYNDQQKFAKQVDRLKTDVDVVKADITKIEETKRKTVDEEAFLKTYVKKAQDNRKDLLAVLDKIAAADKARADAAAAAAAAAKKNS